MSELGQLLRKARIQRGISLDDLQESTKIRKRYLEAIEEGNFKVLPGNFYVRAFIKSYAEAVDLDPVEVLKLYRADVPEPAVETVAEPVRRRRKRKSNTQRMSRWLSALLFIAFPLLILTVIYYFAFNKHEGETPAGDSLPLTDQVSMEDPADDPSSPAAEPVLPEPEPEPEPEPVVSLVKSEGSKDFYILTGSTELRVVVEVTGDRCWMAVRKDNENGEFVEQNLTLQNGEKREWVFEGGAHFRFGRQNAIKVTVNGQEIKMGDTSNPRSLQIDLAADNIPGDHPSSEGQA